MITPDFLGILPPKSVTNLKIGFAGDMGPSDGPSAKYWQKAAPSPVNMHTIWYSIKLGHFVTLGVSDKKARFSGDFAAAFS